MARRGWATGVVAVVAIAAGVGGGAYLYKEAFPTDGAAQGDAGVSDASTDAKAGRGKKVAKRGGRATGKTRRGPRPSQGGGNSGAGNQGGANQGGGAQVGPNNGVDDTDDGTEDEVSEPFVPPFRGRGPAGPTYEAAIASNKQEINMGGKAEPDLSDAQLSRPMQNGSFVGECGAPDAMKVTVKVAIKMGKPAGVSVLTNPSDPDIAGCIDRYVRTFTWPSSGKMDSFTSTY